MGVVPGDQPDAAGVERRLVRVTQATPRDDRIDKVGHPLNVAGAAVNESETAAPARHPRRHIHRVENCCLIG